VKSGRFRRKRPEDKKAEKTTIKDIFSVSFSATALLVSLVTVYFNLVWPGALLGWVRL
jgi:hypothetical protein